MYNAYLALLVLFMTLFVLKRRTRNSHNLPLPPGPTPLPFIGNIYDIPSNAPWRVFKKWGEQYGDMIYFHIFGSSVVVLNSATIAHDLLDKKSAIYSYRPKFTMANDVIGWNFALTSMDYGEKSKRQRKYLQLYFQKQCLPRYYDIHLREVHRLLNDLLGDPTEYRNHIKRMAGGIAMMMTYGHDVKYKDDRFIDLAERGVRTIEAVGAVGAHIVDLIPWLRFIPDWFPGAGIKRLPPGTREDLQAFLHTPFNQVKQQIADGTAVPCYTTALLEETKGEDDEGVLGTAALIYSGGVDTTMSSLMTAFVMLVVDTVVQARVQAEMDMVIGKDRLPTFADRAQMPYMQCVISEAIRWGASTPVGVPHRLSEDDVYNGVYLPAGSMIMANQWAMLHDSRIYPEPSKFNPDRFLQGDGRTPQPDPRNVAFGFGRRVCPGKDVAENTIWAAIASIFYAFKITPARDEYGKDIPIDLEYKEHSVRHPKPFSCMIKPRRANSVALIRQTADS